MTADLDTRPSEAYAPADEILRAQENEADHANADLRPDASSECDAFAGSREHFNTVAAWLESEEAIGLPHGELETHLQIDARELFCQMLQDHLDLRASEEARIERVVDSEGARRGNVEAGHERPLATVFGDVRVRRIAYRARGQANLCPADGALNLPVERHSHGLRRLAAIESTRGSFDGAHEAIERATGRRVANRQLQHLARASAVDFDAFYSARRPAPSERGDAIVLSCDGKGVVMRPEALRVATRKQAAKAKGKLETRLSKGEKAGRKRMAEVGAVYEVAPVSRTLADILPTNEAERKAAAPAPAAKGKWLTASVAEDAATVVARIFDEAERRDGGHERDWVCLVDGNNHQIERIKAEAHSRGVAVTIVCDFVHVLEYLWKAAWSFHAEGDPKAEAWVYRRAMKILDGGASGVARSIRRQATSAGLAPAKRAGAEACATYLVNKEAYLDYPTALRRGWPIATGVIEGACRHLVKDRMDLTGARWGLDGAEAILKLRAIRCNGDFEEYWRFHLAKERKRVHLSRYADGVLPCPA